jgi:hypothetical protein
VEDDIVIGTAHGLYIAPCIAPCIAPWEHAIIFNGCSLREVMRGEEIRDAAKTNNTHPAMAGVATQLASSKRSDKKSKPKPGFAPDSNILPTGYGFDLTGYNHFPDA